MLIKNQIFTKLERGKIDIYYLKEIWTYYQQLKKPNGDLEEVEWKYCNGVFNALGSGIEPTIRYLTESTKSFAEFENWIYQNGNVSTLMIDQFNAIVDGEKENGNPSNEKLFNESDLKYWDKNGYIFLKNAIPKIDCETTVDYIFDQLEADKTNPKTWYHSHPLKQGIMLQLFNSSCLDKNRF